jgi:hypothetical protein
MELSEMSNFRITFTNPGPKFKGQMDAIGARLITTIDKFMHMIQSMIKEKADADISSAGDFGPRWTDGLHVNVEGAAPNMRLYMTHEIPYASVFQEGGTIEGNPKLWIPISGTDAAMNRARAMNYPGGVRGGRGGNRARPLLFSVTDRKPKYIGVDSVTIPKKWHLEDDVNNVMSNYRSVFDEAWEASK